MYVWNVLFIRLLIFWINFSKDLKKCFMCAVTLCTFQCLIVSLSDYNTINTSGDNNLGPDRLAGPKALDPSYCRQPTNPLIARTLSGSPNCAWYWVAPIWGQDIPSTHTINVFSYDAVWAEHRTHHLPNAEQISYVLCNGRESLSEWLSFTFVDVVVLVF